LGALGSYRPPVGSFKVPEEAYFDLGGWSSFEEEDEDVGGSLRFFEPNLRPLSIVASE
jgi:hypothetical protein